MRQIGSTTDLNQAERFADHLRAEGIACTVDQEGPGFRIWVHDDDKVSLAKEAFQQFQADPGNARYQNATSRAMAKLREQLQQQKETRRRIVNLSETWDRPVAQSCPLTIGLIAMSLVVAYFTQLEPKVGDPRVDALFFSLDSTLQPILDGEVWRLVTPIFLHFGIMHLIFNLFYTRDLGFLIEPRVGTFRFLLMVLFIAGLSNFAQFWFVGPRFGGMSGVVYGLFGYAWIRGKFEPGTGFDLAPKTITSMLAWHVLCVMGVIPHIANWAHGMGLVAGMTIAMGRSLWKTILRSR